MSKSPLEMFLIVDIVSVSFLVLWHTEQRHFITQGFNLMLRDRQTSARRLAAAIASVAAAAAFSFGVTLALAVGTAGAPIVFTSLFDDYVPFGLEAAVLDDTRSSAVALRRNRP